MYQEDDHLSNLFRENEHLLDERPSRNAWAKLEGKLDEEKVHSTRRIYRFISTAAAVIAIVTMISAIALFRTGDELMAEKQAEREAIALKEQSTEFSVNDNASDWRKEYAPESIEQEEMAVEEIVVEQEIQPTFIEPKKVQKEERPIIADNAIAKDSEPYFNAKNEELAKPRVSSSAVTKSKLPNAISEATEIMEETVADAMPMKENYGNLSDKMVTNTSDDAARIATRREVEAKKTESYNTEKVKTKASKPKSPTIDNFVWLKGTWSDNTTMGLSYEKWEQTDSKTLTANGYLIQNGDTLYVEQMEIKEIRNKVYYLANFGESKTPIKFELVSYINGVATFENPKADFPSQIILKKQGNGYLITFENSNTANQNQQFEYRNNVSKARASRKMTRSGY